LPPEIFNHLKRNVGETMGGDEISQESDLTSNQVHQPFFRIYKGCCMSPPKNKTRLLRQREQMRQLVPFREISTKTLLTAAIDH